MYNKITLCLIAFILFGLGCLFGYYLFPKEKPLFEPYSKAECVEWCSPWEMKQWKQSVSWKDSCVCGEIKD